MAPPFPSPATNRAFAGIVHYDSDKLYVQKNQIATGGGSGPRLAANRYEKYFPYKKDNGVTLPKHIGDNIRLLVYSAKSRENSLLV